MHPPTHRVEIVVTADQAESVAARLWARGALGIWERAPGLVAWFREPVQLTGPEDPVALGPVLDGARWSLEADRDWQAEWKATIEPVVAGRVVVIPTWLASEHTVGPDQLGIILDPGRAFGSGHHATTALCLELLDELDLAGELRGRRVADIGCGSGILAIAAAGRGASVTAVDIDPDAIAVTGENARRNRVEVHVREGSVESLDATAQIVVANLVTDVVAQLAGSLFAATDDVLIASGITAERSAVALDALIDAGLLVDEIRERDGWIAVRGHRALPLDA